MEIVRPPLVELKQEGMDYSLNEVTLVRHLFPEINGSGLTLSIKEDLFDTLDIDFKNRIVPSELSSSEIDLHATNMASIAAGGGNSDPTAKGVAWDAFISSSDFARLLPDADSYFIEHQISVQNHAYGTSIENYYGIEAAAYDALCHRLPHLVHVFSAGNSGAATPAEGMWQHNLLRWSSTIDHNSIIEYKPIDLANWITIADSVVSSSNVLKWVPPLTGLAQLRWSDGSQIILSDTFLITSPLMPEAKLVCADSFQLGWENKDGADSFELFFLGEKHLQHLDYTTDTLITLPRYEKTHFAVASIFDQRRGPLSYAIDYRTQGVGCYLNTFYLDFVLDNIATMVAQFGSLDQIETITLEEKQGGNFVLLYTYGPGAATQLEFESPPLKNGINLYRLSILLKNGAMVISDTVEVYYSGGFNIYVFPNPATIYGSIKVLVDSRLEGEVVIFDMEGRKYFYGRAEDYPFSIEANQFPPGFYIVSLKSDEGKFYSGKFAIIH